MAAVVLRFPGTANPGSGGSILIRPPDFLFPLIFLMISEAKETIEAEGQTKTSFVQWFLREKLNFPNKPLSSITTSDSARTLYRTQITALDSAYTSAAQILTTHGYSINLDAARGFLLALNQHGLDLISSSGTHLTELGREQRAHLIYLYVSSAVEELNLQAPAYVYANVLPYLSWTQEDGSRDNSTNKSDLKTKIFNFLKTKVLREAIETSISNLISILGAPAQEVQVLDFRNLAESKTDLSPLNDLEHSTNIIYFGPPGTGKTREAKRRSARIVGIAHERSESWTDADRKKFHEQTMVVQFHPSYTYEDFIEGIRPITVGTGEVIYEILLGPMALMMVKADKCTFLQLPGFCDGTVFYPIAQVMNHYGLPTDATKDEFEIQKNWEQRITGIEQVKQPPAGATLIRIPIRLKSWANDADVKKPFVLLIDEINRGKVSQIFGELLYVLGDLGEESDNYKLKVSSQYSHRSLSWPPNLSIIGTMNQTDKSVDDMDQALRRRFEFYGLFPDYNVLRIQIADSWKQWFGKPVESLTSWLEELNDRLSETRESADFQIGHSFFLRLNQNTLDDYKRLIKLVEIFYSEIVPTVESAVYKQREKLSKVLGADVFDHIYDNSSEKSYVPPFRIEIRDSLNRLRDSARHRKASPDFLIPALEPLIRSTLVDRKRVNQILKDYAASIDKKVSNGAA